MKQTDDAERRRVHSIALAAWLNYLLDDTNDGTESMG
ncbi:unnamed protein product [Gongylonema pulchrum]|uniref:Uncharacterized protein n=1 Tax=Gongylonema pulchrum TaxID=637853 RepID=A0A3P6RB77_9BILA|nr:unnamed protein product [Gongylonema pulchrum]